MVSVTDELSGTVALVTGANGGIGRATCAAMAAAGAIVYASDIAAPVDIAGVEVAHCLVHDVTAEEDWQRVASTIEHRHGRLDALVNNAGIAVTDSIVDTTLEVWRRVQAVNVESILLALRACGPLLRLGGAARPGGASVVNLSSIAGLRGAAFHTAYCTSKGAVRLFTKAAAAEYGALGWPIRVNSVHPGSIDTPMMHAIIERHAELGGGVSEVEVQTSVESRHLLGRLGRVDEIAAGVVFLCSHHASFMTGSEMVIDGGFSAI